MATGGSKKVILTALLANLGLGIAKFVGAIISGSAALFAEGVHSMVDTSNQVLLLIGGNAAKRPPTASHPFEGDQGAQSVWKSIDMVPENHFR